MVLVGVGVNQKPALHQNLGGEEKLFHDNLPREIRKASGRSLIATPYGTFSHIPGRWQSVLPKLLSYGSSHQGCGCV